jgi:uncharacterized protein
LSNVETAISETERHIHESFASDTTGHDWWHIWRVRNTAVFLADREGADPEVVELAALLHDIADWKFHDGDEKAGPEAAGAWLEKFSMDESIVRRVVAIVAEVSFKGAGVDTTPSTLEGKCVQDADRLDAIGAIGISRVFAYGGHVQQPIHDPETAPTLHEDFEQYKTKRSTSINHFHEKLLLLSDRMNTPSGQELASTRHRYMCDFLATFEAEWNFPNGA